MNPDVLIGVIGAVVAFGVHMFFRDRDKQRTHERNISVDTLKTAKALTETVEATAACIATLDEHVRTNFDNYKLTMVAVLKDMRELVKNTESERQRTAGVAAATLLRPGKRMPQP